MQKLRKSYGDTVAVQEVSLTVHERGEIFGIIGTNGAGKATTDQDASRALTLLTTARSGSYGLDPYGRDHGERHGIATRTGGSACAQGNAGVVDYQSVLVIDEAAREAEGRG